MLVGGAGVTGDTPGRGELLVEWQGWYMQSLHGCQQYMQGCIEQPAWVPTRCRCVACGWCWSDRVRAAASTQQLAMQLTHGEQHIQSSPAHLHQMTAQEAHTQALNPGQIQPAGSQCRLAELHVGLVVFLGNLTRFSIL